MVRRYFKNLKINKMTCKERAGWGRRCTRGVLMGRFVCGICSMETSSKSMASAFPSSAWCAASLSPESPPYLPKDTWQVDRLFCWEIGMVAGSRGRTRVLNADAHKQAHARARARAHTYVCSSTGPCRCIRGPSGASSHREEH